MRKLKVICILLILVSSKFYAQKGGKKIDDIVFLYVDEKYDKVVFKCEALMKSDSYKKHPLIYIYASMSYLEMSKRPGKYSVGERDSEFPKPLKMAQKHLYKFIKVDLKAGKYYNGNSWYKDFNEFYVQLADTSNKLSQMLFLNEKYRKSASAYKAAYRAVPGDPVLQLWQGIGEMKSKNAVEGKKTLAAVMKKIDKNYVPSKATSGVLALGMLLAEEILRGIGDYKNANKAKELIDVFKKYDPDELDKKKLAERKKKAKKELEDNKVMREFFSDENDEDNKNKKGKIIIKNGSGSDGKSTNADDELDKIEKEAQEDGGNN